MLHPDKIRKMMDMIEQRTGTPLVEYPVEKCRKVYEHFQSITVSDGKKEWYQRPGQTAEEFRMEKWEQEWIGNELLMCKCSFEYWLYRYFYLKDISGFIRLPDKSIAWSVVLDVLREMDGKNLPMILMFLKARQLGISTLVEAIIIWIAMFRRGSYCVISSAEEEKSIKMSEMVWRAIDYLPLWMRPTLTAEDKRQGPVFGYIESAISIQHGSMKKGIGRGDTPVAAHLSECAWYPDPVNTVESSLLRAMHENRRTFLALESTAKKKNDWWHNLWLYNREAEAQGTNKFACNFLPWYVGSDIYPTRDWIRNHPIPDGWKPNTNTRKQAVNAELYVRSTPLLRKHMGDGWRMPMEQQWYYEFEYEQAARTDQTLKAFLAEMAADERSAFQSKKFAVYPQEVLDRLSDGVADKKYIDFAFTGSGIDPKFHLKDYQSQTLKKLVVTTFDNDNNPLEWKLVPLRETPTEDHEAFYVRIWELPKKGYRYTIGIDVSGGVGQDATVMDVIRVGRDEWEPDVQVAQFWSPYISSVEAPPFAHCLGILYGQHMTPYPQALMCPELVLATGDAISFQLDKLGYVNFYYDKRFDRHQTPGHKGRMRGWATKPWNRQLMLETEKMAIESGWVVINSERTVDELSNLESDETDSGKTKWDHAEDEHNDCIFALGIGYFCSHDEETLASRKMGKKPRNRKELDKPESQRETPGGALARKIQAEEEREWKSADSYKEPVYQVW